MASAALLERAQTVSLTDKERGIQLYSEIVRSPEPQLSDEETVRIKEQGIIQLAELFKNDKKSRELADLIYASMPFLSKISKAKASKLMRQLLDVFLDMQAESEVKVQLCQECIEWAKREKRTFLRQSLELRLVSLYFEHKLFTSALTLGSTLLKELKKLDDKNLLVELQLLESKTYHALGNLPRSRAALTAARTTANAIYTPPRLQAALDMQSGVLHAADERDFKTAYSYFYEAFEGYDGVEDARAPLALKYMLLSKVMLNAADDVNGIVSGKLALKYAGRGIDALKQVAAASHKRSLADFQQTLKEFSDELEGDEIIKAHLNTLYDTMLEQNLCRIIEPYSRVQVSYISETIRLDEHQVERKLSQMILDGLLSGVLEQRSGVLVLFDPLAKDELYSTALLTIASLTRVVDTLFQRAKKTHLVQPHPSPAPYTHAHTFLHTYTRTLPTHPLPLPPHTRTPPPTHTRTPPPTPTAPPPHTHTLPPPIHTALRPTGVVSPECVSVSRLCHTHTHTLFASHCQNWSLFW